MLTGFALAARCADLICGARVPDKICVARLLGPAWAAGGFLGFIYSGLLGFYYDFQEWNGDPRGFSGCHFGFIEVAGGSLGPAGGY